MTELTKCPHIISEWKEPKLNRPKCKRIKGLVKVCVGQAMCKEYKKLKAR